MERVFLITMIMSILLSGYTNVLGQEHQVNQIECTLIDKSKPAQFISYENVIKSTSEVRLRLHNNTSCAIVVQIDDKYPTRLVRLPNGGVKIEDVTTSLDGVTLQLHYLIQNSQQFKAPKPAYGWGDSVFTYQLLAGQTAVFIVPRIHFDKRFDIVVPFNYTWEGNNIGIGVGGVIHRVYFLVDDLPRTALRN